MRNDDNVVGEDEGYRTIWGTRIYIEARRKQNRDNAQRMFNFRGNIAATVVWDDTTK